MGWLGPAKAAEAAMVKIGFIKAEQDRQIPISRLDIVADDAGLRGAELAITDNNTTGRFTNQAFELKRYSLAKGGDAAALIGQIAADGVGFVLVDADEAPLLALSDAARGKDMLLFNLAAPDTELRDEKCRANIIHVAPSRDMLADALTQFLVLKRWSRWFLISGANQPDKAMADALRRSAKKFGAQIVEEKAYDVTDSSARTDSGHAQVQQQIAVFTQISTNYDVLVVADESEIFGPYLPFRTWSARPVAGTSGLTPVSWHPAHEQWGATQMQNRFQKLAGRFMTPIDFHAWLAARSVGEAATRTKATAFPAIRDYLLGGEFGVAAFKGQKLSIRKWNQQFRQPIAVATTELPVSWSPQPGFLHQRSETDTLGIDEPESRCKLQ
ncbi:MULTISPECIES: ABC transporter substrate-binding protein [Rhodomicrobium]|uniref:ABC transporter substrate-binding protein n=1 Tax=Rhodomicrobium TaxID=1068 RepID=UPI000B4B2062|nr:MULTISPECIES: ABC transporter substrate-binding protein [Rhodomicrobium]